MKDRALAHLARLSMLALCLVAASCAHPKSVNAVCITGVINLDGVGPGVCFKRKELAGLIDRQVTQEGGAPATLDLTDPKDETKQREVTNCRGYDKLKSAGWYALSGLDISKQSWFQRACGTAEILMTARPWRRSFLQQPPGGLSNLDLVSAAALPQVAESPASPKRGATIGALVKSGQVEINAKDETHLDLVYSGNRVIYDELARGDFNGDGTQDVLLFVGVRAVKGTMHWYEHIALTREKRGAPLTVVLDTSS